MSQILIAHLARCLTDEQLFQACYAEPARAAAFLRASLDWEVLCAFRDTFVERLRAQDDKTFLSIVGPGFLRQLGVTTGEAAPSWVVEAIGGATGGAAPVVPASPSAESLTEDHDCTQCGGTHPAIVASASREEPGDAPPVPEPTASAGAAKIEGDEAAEAYIRRKADKHRAALEAFHGRRIEDLSCSEIARFVVMAARAPAEAPPASPGIEPGPKPIVPGVEEPSAAPLWEETEAARLDWIAEAARSDEEQRERDGEPPEEARGAPTPPPAQGEHPTEKSGGIPASACVDDHCGACGVLTPGCICGDAVKAPAEAPRPLVSPRPGARRGRPPKEEAGGLGGAAGMERLRAIYALVVAAPAPVTTAAIATAARIPEHEASARLDALARRTEAPRLFVAGGKDDVPKLYGVTQRACDQYVEAWR